MYGGARLAVAVGLDQTGRFVEVRDDGDGIPDERLARLFLPYGSTGNARGLPSSIGLGLAVARRLAELMGGSLDYRHEDGWSVSRLQLQPLADVAGAPDPFRRVDWVTTA